MPVSIYLALAVLSVTPAAPRHSCRHLLLLRGDLFIERDCIKIYYSSEIRALDLITLYQLIGFMPTIPEWILYMDTSPLNM